MRHLLLREVSALFQGGTSRSVSVGIEHELLSRDVSDGSVVPIDRVRRAVRGSSYQSWVGFEPGGQVELSLPCSPSLPQLAATWEATIEQLTGDCTTAGIELDSAPVDDRPVPRQLASRRYVEMERHFDRIGSAGRRMMRRTASTQVCLDWWPGAAGLEQWRLALSVAPFLAAAFARSTGPASRLATWLAVDPSRTAYDDRLVRGHDPVAAYAAFAAGATVFGMPGDDSEEVSFTSWSRTHEVTTEVVRHHLSTLFPPVRPRGRYLELRFLDVQPVDLVVPVAAVLSRLLYDDDVRRQARRLVEGEALHQVDVWELAALAPEELADTSSALLSLAGWSVPTLVGVA
jgi:gamma-glutamylcysteine synthetase